jgi:hypothetical protein
MSTLLSNRAGGGALPQEVASVPIVANGGVYRPADIDLVRDRCPPPDLPTPPADQVNPTHSGSVGCTAVALVRGFGHGKRRAGRGGGGRRWRRRM